MTKKASTEQKLLWTCPKIERSLPRMKNCGNQQVIPIAHKWSMRTTS